LFKFRNGFLFKGLNKMTNPIRALNEYFSDESKWCKGVLARDKDNLSGYPFQDIPDPVKCCIMGGIMLVVGDVRLMGYDSREIMDTLYEALPPALYDVLPSLEGTPHRCVLVFFNNHALTTFPIFKAFLNRAEALWDERHKSTDISIFTDLLQTKEQEFMSGK
jgi:hypothetical protein